MIRHNFFNEYLAILQYDENENLPPQFGLHVLSVEVRREPSGIILEPTAMYRWLLDLHILYAVIYTYFNSFLATHSTRKYNSNNINFTR